MKAKHLVKICPMFFLVFLVVSPSLSAQGHFEFGFHFGSWGINFVESILNTELEEMLPDILLGVAEENNENLENTSFNLDDFAFESGRNNWGVEVRWYPGGYGRSFSLGFSVERTSIRISSDFSASMELIQFDEGETRSATLDLQGSGQFEMNPTSVHFHFRWDIFPLARIRPFFTFGVGIAGMKTLQDARLSASLIGEFQITGEETESIDESLDKTLKELEDDAIADGEAAFLPTLLPFVQLNFGIKGEITKNIYLLLDTGIFNGFILRGGISFRI